MARAPFKLKSGNSIPFKQMGSSPVRDVTEEEHSHMDKEQTVHPTTSKNTSGGAGIVPALLASALSGPKATKLVNSLMGEVKGGDFQKAMAEAYSGSRLSKYVKGAKYLGRGIRNTFDNDPNTKNVFGKIKAAKIEAAKLKAAKLEGKGGNGAAKINPGDIDLGKL